MSWVAVAVASVSATTALYSGYSNYQNSKYQAEQAQADAKAVAAQGRLEAERIRKDKLKAQSAARAAAAGNGLDVNEGTALVINDEIEKAGNYDANIAEITGRNTSQRLNAESKVHKGNANSALFSGVIDAASTGAKSYMAMGGWK